MTLREILLQSTWTKGAFTAGAFAVLGIAIVGMLTLIAYLLHRLFKGEPGLTRAYKFLIYLSTMLAVVFLFAAGLLGLFIPVIPGVLFLFLGLILLRRYYRNKWVDRQVEYLGWCLRLRRSLRKAKAKVRKERKKIGKALRGKGPRTTP